LQMALTDLPPTLYETYDRILLHIDERDRGHALKLLQWLAFSVDKVSLSEAVDILATNPDAVNGPLFDRDRRFDDPRDILTICSSLVTFTVVQPDPEYLESKDRGNFTELRLAHFSVREYLVSEGLRSHFKLTIYHCNEKQANTFIAKTCLAYLLQFKQHGCISEGTCISHPLCSYAARYWIRHAQPDNDNDTELRRLIMALLQSKNAGVYSNWLELDNIHPKARGTPIYYTSMAGLARASQDLLENGADVHAQGGLYGNALQAASLRGHQATVELLLEKGADVNAQGGRYGNVLQAASSEGHQATVKLLLEKGAYVNAQGGGYYGNALQAASSQGHQATVELLLENGAYVNMQGGYYGNALQAASSGGHQATVELLLEKGAAVNAQGYKYGNALQAASSGGHRATVELLLE
ncbi:ankyrin repeat protein, partial [Gautieria morchelliformis]